MAARNILKVKTILDAALATGQPQDILLREWERRVQAERIKYAMAYQELVVGVVRNLTKGFRNAPTARGGNVTVRVGKTSVKVRWQGFNKEYRRRKEGYGTSRTFWNYKGSLGDRVPIPRVWVRAEKITNKLPKSGAGVVKRGESAMFRVGADLKFSPLPFPLNDLVRTPFLTGEAPRYSFGENAGGVGNLNLILILEHGSEGRETKRGPNPLPARPWIVALSAKFGSNLGA